MESRTVKGYILEVESLSALHGSFPPADPYIYCQNDPEYTGHAASAVTISVFLANPDTGINGLLEFGWKKERKQGSKSITKKLFVTVRAYDVPASSLPIDIADIPSTQFTLAILRDCPTGAFSFHLNGNDVTPTSLNQVVVNKIKQMKAKFVKTIVELHDNRSRAPGTNNSRYVVTNIEYRKCSGFVWYNALGTEQVDPGSATEVKINKPDGETFECWDTRN